MVGAAPALNIALAAGAGLFAVVAQSLAQPHAAIGECRDGVPNGSYELRTPDGHVRVVGAFARGRMTGTFIFWTGRGARTAVLPLDNGEKNGTVALWYTAPDLDIEAGRKLEAPYVQDRLHGIKRSWHANGAPRAEYRYERGTLSAAHAWTESGAPLSAADARQLAASDAEADNQSFAALLDLVRDNLPPCD